MAGEKKTKSFIGLVKANSSLYDFDKEMVGINETNTSPEIKDVHEKNDIHELVPFSTRISKGTYKKIRQYEYWERATITEIVEMALMQFLEGKESAIKELPDKEIKRLEELSKKKKKGSRK